MGVGHHLSFSPFNEFKARVKNPGFFNKVVLNVQLHLQRLGCEHSFSFLAPLIAASKIKLTLMDAVKTDEQTPLRELIPFGQTLDFFGFRSAPGP